MVAEGVQTTPTGTAGEPCDGCSTMSRSKVSRNKTINTIHNKLQAFLKLLEFRIIGSDRDRRRAVRRLLDDVEVGVQVEVRYRCRRRGCDEGACWSGNSPSDIVSCTTQYCLPYDTTLCRAGHNIECPPRHIVGDQPQQDTILVTGHRILMMSDTDDGPPYIGDG
jgi:hypothetical protein